jgi:hypothetical protein
VLLNVRCPVSNSELETRRIQGNENYLNDNEKGLQQLITWFLNDIMKKEVPQQA